MFDALRGAKGGDVGMLQARLNLDLAEEPLRQFLVGVQIRQQHLHRLDAIGDGVADLVDLAHAARAKHADNLVIARCNVPIS